jgi:hypothetical protein
MLTLSRAAAAEDVRMTADGFLVRDGSPHFVIGMHESTDDDNLLREMADHGVSLIRVSADVKSLDRVHKHGLSGWIPLGAKLALPENDEEKRRAPADDSKLNRCIPIRRVWMTGQLSRGQTR